MQSKKNILFILGLICLAGIFLFSCDINFLADISHPRLAKKIAKANHLASNDITVQTSHFKANYCDITFQKIPPSGKYDTTPILKAISSLKRITGPLFIRVSIPGGNPSAFWDIPADSMDIIKTGTAPIVFDTAPGVTPAKKQKIQVENWTMNDLFSLPERLSVDNIDIKMASQDKFDWLFLKKHPNLSTLRLSGTAGFIHADKLDSVNCSLIFKDNKNLVLPRKLNCRIFALDGSNVDAELLERLDPEKLVIIGIVNCQKLDLANINRLKKCRMVTFRNCPDIQNLTSLAGMPELGSLEISDCPIKDVSGIKNIPKLRILRLWKTQLPDLSSFRDCKIWRVKIQQQDLATISPLKNHIAGIEILDFNNIRFENGLKL